MTATDTTRPLARRIADRLEGMAFLSVMGLFGALGLDRASAFGGWLGRTIGPLSAEHGLARGNLEKAFPEKSRAEIDAILKAMWDNLGRTLAEYPHLGEFHCYEPGGRIEVVGPEHVDRQHAVKPGAFLVSGHFANWELMPMACAQRGYEGGVVYRIVNNPYVDRWIMRQRRAHVMKDAWVPKGTDGARQLLKLVKQRRYIPFLIDQKLAMGGVPVDFFGRPAMTTPAIAALSLRYDYPVFMAHCERLDGARFRIVVSDRLAFERSNDQQADILNAMQMMNDYLEARIRERPGEWLWAHNRWNDRKKKKRKRKK